jgi:hypothetical protein
MMPGDDTEDDQRGGCIVPSHPVAAQELARYSPERDPHSEQDIANYVEGQAPEEVVQWTSPDFVDNHQAGVSAACSKSCGLT